MLSLPSLAQRTRAGARFLDERISNWHRRIDSEKLAVEDGGMCILGQLTGTFISGLIHLTKGIVHATELGFYAHGRDQKRQQTHYLILTMEWRERIAERLREDNVRMIARMQVKTKRKRFAAIITSAAMSILCILCI